MRKAIILKEDPSLLAVIAPDTPEIPKMEETEAPGGRETPPTNRYTCLFFFLLQLVPVERSVWFLLDVC